MNRKSKVIVSIVGITIVLLALLGITYAYYLTRIEGNTNTNSISITTADLKLVYRDGNGHVSKENIMPGTTIEKTFTVENTGDNTVNDYAVYLEELTNTLNRTEDLTYELSCASTGEDCFGGSGEFPQLAGIIATNSIEKDVIHTYTLKVTYINHETIDQSEDMGSVISAFVQIYAMKDVLDIEGEVTGASEGDYAQINSVQKRSQIVDGKYKFAGVLPGKHTIKICEKDDTVCSNDTAKLKKEIVVNVGITANTSGNTITMTDDSQTASININLTGTTSVTIGTSLKKYNPFKEGTLAYNILNNAYNPLSSSSTKYSKNPLTIPGKETSAVKYIEGELSTEEETFKSYLGSTSKYYTYGDTYSYTSSNYTITNNDGSAVKAVQGFSSLKGKYIADLWGSPYSNPVSANNKGTIYYVVDVDDTRIYYIELSYGRASNETYFTYGDTYEFNESTGKYRIINSDGSPLQIVQYKTNFEELKGKYVSSWSGYTSSSAASKTLENLNTLFKISTNSTSELRKFYRISESTKSISMEKVLSETKDDYGTSYYYRGGVEDNYVNYSGMCWRIVRIDGNGNIKIILADRNNECNSDSYSKDNTLSGFLKLNDYENDEPVVNTYYDNFSDDISLYSDWGISEELNSWVSSSNLDTSKLLTTNWCNDSSYYKKDLEYYDEEWNVIDGSNPDLIYETYITKYYNVDKRLQYKDGLIPTLKCNMTGIENSKSTKVYSNIGLITADEAVFAGAIYVSNYSSNYNYVNYYLLDNASGNSYYTLTPYMETNAYFDKIISVSHGMVSSGEAQGSLGALRPVVVLKNDVQFSGNGTQSNPYVIN